MDIIDPINFLKLVVITLLDLSTWHEINHLYIPHDSNVTQRTRFELRKHYAESIDPVEHFKIKRMSL